MQVFLRKVYRVVEDILVTLALAALVYIVLRALGG